MCLHDLYKTPFNYPHYITAYPNPPQQLKAATASSMSNGLFA